MTMFRKPIIVSCIASLLLLGVSVHAQQTATATATVYGGFVVGVDVTDGGSGYGWAPVVVFTGGGGIGAAAYATVSNGVVTSITVTNAGFGYTNEPQVVIAPPVTTPFSSSLVLNLPLDGSVADVGPNHFSVADNNGATFVPDRTGFADSALALNGVNQNLSLSYDARLYSDEFALSLWVNFQRLSGDLWRAGNASADGWHGYNIEFSSGALGYQDYTGSGYNASLAVPITSLLLNQWYQLVVSRSSNSCTIYLNGVEVDSQTNLTPYAKLQGGTPMSIGANNNDPSGFFNYCQATLDTIHIYNRALSDSEVQTLYADESAGMPPEVGIVVKTIRVNMMRLELGQTYQLESSTIPSSSSSWSNVGPAFQATNSTEFQDIDIIGTPMGFYRVVELP